MTAEELSKALYEKLMQEQEQYAEWLKTQPPDVILKHAYEYAVREDIVLLLEYNVPTEQEARALLQEHNVIEKVLQLWVEKETSYMQELWQTMEQYAEDQLRIERKEAA